ncbi:WD repeat-containing protein-like protein [Microthyrium microscopicum]|uniref:WD repeat-containing protein-like protein n=1 Tax=Microthyrium microscopicum TaxID=703497 RepID=A0A6A6UQV1_9PEZI|nr:WD repeat-containing protein-like protein [Microthyrium microscopicum]
MRLDGTQKGSQSPSHSLHNGSNTSNGHSPTIGKVTNGHGPLRLPSNGTHRIINGLSPAKSYPPIWHDHNREEVSRLLIQALNELGYTNSAKSLSRESGYELETPNVSSFRNAVLEGRWDDAELLLFGENAYAGEPSEEWRLKTAGLRTRAASWTGKGLALVNEANSSEMLFWIRQQKYLELLEKRDLTNALVVLRQQLTPHSRNTQRLHALGGLLMCASVDDLKTQADWDGARGDSRHHLLSQLSRLISPKVMIPENRLSDLLHQVKNSWIVDCLYHNTNESPSLYSNHTCDRNDFPYQVVKDIAEHADEIWYIEFSHNGKFMATGGKDKMVIIYDVQDNFKVLHRFDEHGAGVCYLSWSPDDTKLITCARQPDNSLRVYELKDGHISTHIHHFDAPPTVAIWLPDGENFLVGSLDYHHAIEICNIYEDVMDQFAGTDSKARIYDLALSPDGKKVVAMSKNRLYVFDFASKKKLSEWQMDDVEMTSVHISRDSKHMLVSMNPNKIQLINIENGDVVRTYEGHKQEGFLIRSNFGGAAGTFVMSGSEDSQIYIWRTSGQLVEVLPGHGADSGCVNALAWHPTIPSYFASAGDDGRVKM